MLIQRGTSRGLSVCAWILALVTVAATAQPRTASPLAVQSDERTGVYTLGREVVFTIKPTRATESVDLDAVAATITRDGWQKLTTPPARRNGDSLEVHFTPEAAGWYMCEASPADDAKAVARAGIVVGPEKIAPSIPAPDDLDDFWDLRRAALAAMPWKTEPTPTESPESEVECFSVELPCPQTNPVRGYFAQPKDVPLRSAPAILYVRAAGVSGDWCKASPRNAASLAKQYGAIVLDINAHGMLNGQPPEYYQNLEQRELRNYGTQGSDDKDSFYFVGMYVRLLRAIEFIASRDAWDGKHLITIGESQGGGQALAAAGLDKRVSAVVAIVPALCDLTGPLVGRAGGWPMPLGREVESVNARKIIAAVPYCDNVHLAQWSQAETLIFAGLIDTTCSPAGIIATYNALPGNKRIILYPHKAHNGLPPEDLWLGDMDLYQDRFIRGHIGR